MTAVPMHGTSETAPSVRTTPKSARSTVSEKISRTGSGRRASRGLIDGRTPEEQLVELREKYADLEGDRRTAVEIAQFTIRQNRQTIAALKKEQKDVKAELTKRNSLSRNHGGKSNIEKEIGELEKQVHELRRTHDKLIQQRQRSTAKLGQIRDGIADLERGSTKKDNAVLRNVRQLENRLDKALMKRNEAVSIQRTYEQLSKRLRDECETFNLELKSMEDALAAKTNDVAHLQQISHDAQHAKEQAKQELAKVKDEIDRERAKRNRDLEEQRNQLRAVQEMARALKQRQQPKPSETGTQLNGAGQELSCCTDYAEAFQRLCTVSHIESVADLGDKYASQSHTFEDLRTRERECRKKHEELLDKREELQSKLDALKMEDPACTGSGALVDRAQEELVAAAEEEHAAGAELHAESQSLASVKTGLMRIVDLLDGLPSQVPPIPVSDDTLVESVVQCGDRVQAAMSELQTLDVDRTPLDFEDSVTRTDSFTATMEFEPGEASSENSEDNTTSILEKEGRWQEASKTTCSGDQGNSQVGSDNSAANVSSAKPDLT